MEHKNIDEKFGPAPEQGVKRIMLQHFVACILVLLAVRPPFVSDGKKTRHILILIISVALTYILFQWNASVQHPS